MRSVSIEAEIHGPTDIDDQAVEERKQGLYLRLHFPNDVLLRDTEDQMRLLDGVLRKARHTYRFMIGEETRPV